MNHVFVKASDLVSNQGLQGVLECAVSEYNFTDNTAKVVLPNGNKCEEIIDASKIFASERCDEQAKIISSLIIKDKADNKVFVRKSSFIVKDFELLCHEPSYIKWSADPKKCLIAFGSMQINPSEFVFYDSKEDALKLEQIKVTYQDGREELQGGWAKKFFLTEEQNALIKKLEGVFEECKQAGIEFNYDICNYDGLHAFRTNVEGYNITSSENCDAFLPSEVLVKVKACVGDMNIDCPYFPSAFKKE